MTPEGSDEELAMFQQLALQIIDVCEESNASRLQMVAALGITLVVTFVEMAEINSKDRVRSLICSFCTRLMEEFESSIDLHKKQIGPKGADDMESYTEL